jgi:hypothetical protein
MPKHTLQWTLLVHLPLDTFPLLDPATSQNVIISILMHSLPNFPKPPQNKQNAKKTPQHTKKENPTRLSLHLNLQHVQKSMYHRVIDCQHQRQTTHKHKTSSAK